jgi:diguanylate cyclase (GGDEF)-like protein
MRNELEILRKRYERERLIRRQAEQIAEDKSRELYIKGQELEKAIAAEKLAKQEIERLSNTDVLTGLNNRRYFNTISDREFRLAVRHEKPLSALMLDIDYFKKVNDTYGHAVGDTVLVEIAAACLTLMRSTDLCARYGGEEICILLPETGSTGANVVAVRLLTVISSLVFEAGGQRFAVTASIGVAERTADEDSLAGLLKRSDDALYKAKREGRNRVIIWTSSIK